MNVVSFEGGGGNTTEGHEKSVKARLIEAGIADIVTNILNKGMGLEGLVSVIVYDDCEFKVRQKNKLRNIEIIVEAPNRDPETKKTEQRITKTYFVQGNKILTGNPLRQDDGYILTQDQIGVLKDIVANQNESGDEPED